MINTIIPIFQIIFAIILTVLILLQSNGDSDNSRNVFSSVKFQKRGWEKIIFTVTIVVLILFIITSVIQILI